MGQRSSPHDHEDGFRSFSLDSSRDSPRRTGWPSVDWLCSQGFFSEGTSVDEASKFILSGMVTDQEFSASLCRILEQWAT